MLTRNHFGSFLVIFLWVVMSVPGFIEAQQSAEPKIDPPRAGVNGTGAPRCIYCPQPEYSEKARKAGILVITLDTPLDPVTAADANFATDNR